MPDVLAAIDIFCLPSLWEGLPIAMLEAMAMHKAIIASDIDGITDLITDKENGFLIPPLNPTELAKAIELLAPDKVLQLSFGEKVGALIDQKCRLARIAQQQGRQHDHGH